MLLRNDLINKMDIDECRNYLCHVKDLCDRQMKLIACQDQIIEDMNDLSHNVEDMYRAEANTKKSKRNLIAIEHYLIDKYDSVIVGGHNDE